MTRVQQGKDLRPPHPLPLLPPPTPTPTHHRPRTTAARFSSSAGDAKQEHYRAQYLDILRSLGGSLPPASAAALAGGGAAPAAAQSKAPPLAPAKVLAAAKQSTEELLAQQDPPLTPEALLFLGDLFWSGLSLEGGGGVSIPKDEGKAAALWQAAGERGDVEGTYNYANCLLFGQGVPEDRARSQALLEQLATQGHPQACYSLAILLTAMQHQQQQMGSGSVNETAGKGSGGGGKGVRGKEKQQPEEDDGTVRVYELLVKAVKGGCVPAIHNLANVLAEGRSPQVPRNDEAA